MATQLAILETLLITCAPEESSLRILGHPFRVEEPSLVRLSQRLQESEDFSEDWPDLKRAAGAGLTDPRGGLADARCLMLFSHLQRLARAACETGEMLMPEMMTWLGKGKHRISAENTIWFLLEMEPVGSESAHDIVNVIGGECTFLNHFFSNAQSDEILEQAGIYLAMLFHLRQKWPDYYKWMKMEHRMVQMRELFLLGGEDLEIVSRRNGKPYLAPEFVDVYRMLSKTMYQTSFFVKLQTYAKLLHTSRGTLTPEVLAIRDELFAD